MTDDDRAARQQDQREAAGRVHNRYQTAFLLVDFAAALQFVVGSVFFFFPDWQYAGTWLFLIGSLCFAVKPSLRLARLLHLRRMARKAELTLETLVDPRHSF